MHATLDRTLPTRHGSGTEIALDGRSFISTTACSDPTVSDTDCGHDRSGIYGCLDPKNDPAGSGTLTKFEMPEDDIDQRFARIANMLSDDYTNHSGDESGIYDRGRQLVGVGA